jgi:hypothetical protein
MLVGDATPGGGVEPAERVADAAIVWLAEGEGVSVGEAKTTRWSRASVRVGEAKTLAVPVGRAITRDAAVA